MSNIFRLLLRSASFALWSLRRRSGQFVPVALSFCLLVGTVQAIGALHDVSSVLARQQIARSWRGPYDLLVRPQTAISQPERNAGWIDPQSVLENYGGISTQQVADIRALAHVAQITPFATAGWQDVDVLVPVELGPDAVYRISAGWNGPWGTSSEAVRYVDVTNLSHLVTETPLTSIIVQHVIAKDNTSTVIFPMPLQALQAVVGVPTFQEATLQQVLLENSVSASTLHLSLRIERLQGGLNMLPQCLQRASCWEPVQVQQGTVTYSLNGVQLWRYSSTDYVATPQQITAGQVSIAAIGRNMQGTIYRKLLPGYVTAPADTATPSSSLLPLSGIESMPLLPAAVRFVPIEQLCSGNTGNCYSGLYIRLNGVEHYSQASLALLQATAATISARTGLHVDILDGSSLRTISILVPDTSHKSNGSPILMKWLVLGVAVQITNGIDALQEMLLTLSSIVCLLAIGTAGALVGVGRRKEALILRQLGWQKFLLIALFTLDGLALCFPGCLLAFGFSELTIRLWGSSWLLQITWLLLAVGLLVYCCSLVSASCLEFRNARSSAKRRRYPEQRQVSGINFSAKKGESLPIGAGEAVERWWGRLRRPTVSHSARPAAASLASSFAIVSTVFLIAMEYLLVNNLNNALVVTILGHQVREALQGPQLLLLLLVIAAALLTIAVCSILLLRGKREELHLLSMLGWEKQIVFLRIMRDCWVSGLLSGAVGAVLAIGVAMLVGASSTLLSMLSLLLLGPLVGVLLVSVATSGAAWQETERVFVWR